MLWLGGRGHEGRGKGVRGEGCSGTGVEPGGGVRGRS